MKVWKEFLVHCNFEIQLGECWEFLIRFFGLKIVLHGSWRFPLGSWFHPRSHPFFFMEGSMCSQMRMSRFISLLLASKIQRIRQPPFVYYLLVFLIPSWHGVHSFSICAAGASMGSLFQTETTQCIDCFKITQSLSVATAESLMLRNSAFELLGGTLSERI